MYKLRTKKTTAVLAASLAMSLGFAESAQAIWTYTNTTNRAWEFRYFYVGAGRDVPRTTYDGIGLFSGYVSGWGGIGGGFNGYEFHFNTRLKSTVNQAIGLSLYGDDGVSIFVNDVRVSSVVGGGTNYTLNAIANVPYKVTYAYQQCTCPGGFEHYATYGITNLPNVLSDAVAVPEPTTAVAIFGTAGMLLRRRRSPKV